MIKLQKYKKVKKSVLGVTTRKKKPLEPKLNPETQRKVAKSVG